MASSRVPWRQVVARVVSFAALGFWLGGLLFLGAFAAPAVTRVAREHQVRALAAEMVGRMVDRFLPVLAVLGVVLLLAWVLEPVMGGHRAARRLWWLQGGVAAAMLLLVVAAAYGPGQRMKALQPALLPQLARAWSASPAANAAPAGTPLPGVDARLQAQFDAAHRAFQRLVSATALLALCALGAMVLRITWVPQGAVGTELSEPLAASTLYDAGVATLS